MHYDNPITLEYPGLAGYTDPDAVSGLPGDLRYYPTEPARDGAPYSKETNDEFTD